MIYLGADKHGLKAINIVKKWLVSKNVEFENLGVEREDQDIKLEKLLPKFVKRIKEKSDNLGIVSCGTGVGVEVGVNKYSGIRAVLAYDPEIAQWSKTFDKCNVLCLVGWRPDKQLIEKILEVWFSTKYDGDSGRLIMFDEFNKWH